MAYVGSETFQVLEIEGENERNKKYAVSRQMLAEQEIVLLRNQIQALRTALGESEKEAGEMRKKLDKEVNKFIALTHFRFFRY